MQQQHPPTYKHVTHVTQYKFNQGLSLTLQLERASPNTGYLSALAKATEVGREKNTHSTGTLSTL